MSVYDFRDLYGYINIPSFYATKKETKTVANHRESGPAGRLFRLMRDKDETDVSGTGHVASGTVWPDGSVTLKWHTNGATGANINHYPSLGNMLGIHGHLSKVWPYGYTTKVVYVENEEPIAGKLLRELSEFAYELGNAAERAEKGLALDATWLKASYGRILDLAQSAA